MEHVSWLGRFALPAILIVALGAWFDWDGTCILYGTAFVIGVYGMLCNLDQSRPGAVKALLLVAFSLLVLINVFLLPLIGALQPALGYLAWIGIWFGLLCICTYAIQARMHYLTMRPVHPIILTLGILGGSTYLAHLAPHWDAYDHPSYIVLYAVAVAGSIVVFGIGAWFGRHEEVSEVRESA